MTHSNDYHGRSDDAIFDIDAEFSDRIVLKGDLVDEGPTVVRSGLASLIVEAEHPDLVIASADKVWMDSDGRIHLRHHNAYVNTGLNNALDREFGLGGTAVGFIGVDNNATAVTATTVFLHGAGAGTQPPTASANQVIKAATPVRASQTVTATVTSAFVNGDFTGGGNVVFIWNKIGLLTTATDAGTGLVDVIGGTGGASPYNRTFSLDLVSAGTFSVVAAIAVTASAI